MKFFKVTLTLDNLLSALPKIKCILNIWGGLLFLRVTWVIGQAGLLEGLFIILLANLVSIITTISMSAICTNGAIKAGGIYYIISRSLGN